MRPLRIHNPADRAVAAKRVEKSEGKRAKDQNVVAAARRGKKGSPISGRRLWDNIKSLVGTIAIFLVLRAFFVEAYRIPSGSMIPTLLIGDWLFVNKLVYGPHVPFTGFNLPGYAEPARGDVVQHRFERLQH